MALEDDDTTWMQDLENALLGEDEIPDDALRPEEWQKALGVLDKGNQMVLFNDVFDLPQQIALRDECQQFVDKLGNEDEDKVSVVSDLESILTFYCKSHGLEYEKGCGWVEMLLPLLSLKLPRAETYNLFEAILTRYVPRGCRKNGTPFHLFRLLLLYHDPELCSSLDTMRISPDQYCLTWFQSLFAATCSLPVVLCMWDVYFRQEDPFFIYFLALVMLVNARSQIIGLKNSNKQEIIDILSSMPCALEADDVNDFCSLAQYYAFRTPSTFRRELSADLFGSPGVSSSSISQALCLPVSAQELIENAEASNDVTEQLAESVRFFLVDCRPAEQYNAGHLPTAFHLDCNLMLQEPAAFATAVQGLLSAQRQALAARSAAGGEHLCFLGSGRVEEDQYTHMVVASFLQKHTSFVSMLTGGYQAVHEFLREDLNQYLEDHNTESCLVCAPSTEKKASETVRPNSSSSDLFGKISAAMKTKSAEMKGKLFEYIVNPTGSNSVDRHVSSNDKLGKRYRNVAPVFCIDDEQDGEGTAEVYSEDVEEQDVVSISTWLKKPEVIESFKCHEVKVNGYMYESHLLVTDSHIYVLRDIPERKGLAHIAVRRPLSAIVKITSKKKHPEVITFKYGVPEGDGLIISDMDKFYIPNASEATKLISHQILKHLKSKES
ncbi:TBC1 domain family member 23 [Schistocerca piceifrons]|uniref:TBC1 domain family member 23 n=1 Tax=Schistocerca piceifrons TaxID=274613 RepID=UPI001F5EB4C1|nr:TBC1 domain family member 23 [Schistocerca piceifrons]XP_049940513.1 TBC1 domain family member 23 [Schistocerca serialis cubense]